MSEHKSTTEQHGELDADSVAAYLRRHPEFFNEHPELLSQLQIPHDSGAAISLVERQMSILRAQNQKHQQKLRELIEIAGANEELARRMHMLALTLMDAGDPAEIFATLYENLRQNFHADFAVVRLFADPATADDAGDEFAGPDDAGHSLFKAIIDGGRPLCGQLKRQQQVYLFGNEGDPITSGVMVPLLGEGWQGIMAIGSCDPDRFHPGMGVDLLSNLGEILGIVLKRWVATG
jgi:uncharacterized protein